MSQSGGFDMSKIPTGEKLVGGAAAIFIIWVLIPTWYSCCDVEGLGTVLSEGVNGFRGLVILAWLLAVAAVVEIALHWFGSVKVDLPMKRGQLHLIVGAVALVCTLLGLFIRPGSFGVSASISWGLFVGIILAIVWTYGAYMMYNAPEQAMTGGSMGDTPPPPPSGPTV
jgi:hypothetical protein